MASLEILDRLADGSVVSVASANLTEAGVVVGVVGMGRSMIITDDVSADIAGVILDCAKDRLVTGSTFELSGVHGFLPEGFERLADDQCL